MPSPSVSKFGAFLVAAILCVAAFQAWRGDRRDRAQLAAELASTKQLLAVAGARQRDRDMQLAQTLSALAAQKRSITTPAQILRELPKQIPLPAPITLQPSTASLGARFSASPPAPLPEARVTSGSPAPNANTAATLTTAEPFVGARLASPAATTPKSNQKPPASAVIPAADLKPLYDFTLDCQACQAKLSTAQANLADEKAKTAALTKERDDALRIAKGGSAWRRVTRAAKWFLLGAAASALVAKAH